MEQPKYYPLIAGILLVLLIIVHGFFGHYFIIDNISVVLMLGFLTLPYLPHVSAIKFGSFEADISRQDVDSVGAKAGKLPKTGKSRFRPKNLEDIESLAGDEPTLAMARARIEIEKRIKSLRDIYITEPVKPTNLKAMISELSGKQIISDSLEALLVEVVEVSNQAIHGASIDKVDSIRFARYSRKAIEELDRVVFDQAMKSSAKKAAVKANKTEANISYNLKTIIPYSSKPIIKRYVLDQAGLDTFLDWYDDNSEFIISLNKKPNRKSKLHD